MTADVKQYKFLPIFLYYSYSKNQQGINSISMHKSKKVIFDQRRNDPNKPLTS